MTYSESSPTISAKPVGLGAVSRPWIFADALAAVPNLSAHHFLVCSCKRALRNDHSPECLRVPDAVDRLLTESADSPARFCGCVGVVDESQASQHSA